jgi:hypothetical protein
VFLVTRAVFVGRALVNALLAALNARPAAALLTTPTLHLGSGVPPTLGPNADSTGWTESTWTGYAAIPLVTFSGPINPSLSLQALVTDSVFTMTGATPTTGVSTFWWIDTGVAGPVYWCGAFDAGVPFNVAGDFLALQNVLPIANTIDVPA